MLPGVVPFAYPDVAHLRQGSFVAVVQDGNKAAMAVGELVVSPEQLKQGGKGKAVKVLHCFTDQLWMLGTKQHPPLLPGPVLAEVDLAQEAPQESIEPETTEEPQIKETKEENNTGETVEETEEKQV